jgi:hypothetical protein
MIATPFFCLKIACIKSMVLRVAHQYILTYICNNYMVLQIRRILLRLGFYIPDCGISCNVQLQTARAVEIDHRLLAVRAKNKIASVGSSRTGCATVGISQPSQHDIPVPTRSWVVAKICWIWRTSFSIYGCATLWTVVSKDVSFLHTTILTMCTAKKVNSNLEAKAPLRCRLS